MLNSRQQKAIYISTLVAQDKRNSSVKRAFVTAFPKCSIVSQYMGKVNTKTLSIKYVKGDKQSYLVVK